MTALRNFSSAEAVCASDTVGSKSCEAGHLHGAENSDLSSVLEMTSRDIRSGSAENDSDLHM